MTPPSGLGFVYYINFFDAIFQLFSHLTTKTLCIGSLEVTPLPPIWQFSKNSRTMVHLYKIRLDNPYLHVRLYKTTREHKMTPRFQHLGTSLNKRRFLLKGTVLRQFDLIAVQAPSCDSLPCECF